MKVKERVLKGSAPIVLYFQVAEAVVYTFLVILNCSHTFPGGKVHI